MSGPDLPHLPARTPTAVQRKKVLTVSAGLVLAFGVADAVAVNGFAGKAAGIRVAWAGVLLGLAYAGPRILPRMYRQLMRAAAAFSALAYTGVALFTGGSTGGLFAWSLALPVVIATFLQEDTRGVLVGAVATWACGMALMFSEGRNQDDLVLWTLLYAASASIAIIGSAAYHRVREDESAAAAAHLAVVTRLAASERDRGLAEQAQADAEAAIRVRQEVLDIVAHDLRSPLTSITTVAQLLLATSRTQGGEDPSRKRLEMLWRSARHMNRLINDLLDISRLEGARFSLELQPHRVPDLLTQTLETMQPLAAARSQTLKRGAAPEETVDCDQLRVFQVLCNLVGNAIKFSPEGAAVTVSARTAGMEVEFCVSDTGPGIPPEHLPRIFGQFWQARSTDSRGIGLGLAIAKGIVDAHRGRIWVESEAGKGATFRFTLPRERAR